MKKIRSNDSDERAAAANSPSVRNIPVDRHRNVAVAPSAARFPTIGVMEVKPRALDG
jgi:hypothetical protein